jgi:hypothetical protein
MSNPSYERLDPDFVWFRSNKQGMATVSREKIERLLGDGSNDEWYGTFTSSSGETTMVCAWSHNHSLNCCNIVSIFAEKKYLIYEFKSFLEKP